MGSCLKCRACDQALLYSNHFDRLIAEVDGSRTGFGENIACNHDVFSDLHSRRQFKFSKRRRPFGEFEVHMLCDVHAHSFNINDRKLAYGAYMSQFANDWKGLVASGRKAMLGIVCSAYKTHSDPYVLVRSLITHVFAVSTLLYRNKKEEGSSAEEETEKNSNGKEPYRSQILSLLILFDGIVIVNDGGSVSVKVPKQFVQIGTGEGNVTYHWSINS